MYFVLPTPLLSISALELGSAAARRAGTAGVRVCERTYDIATRCRREWLHPSMRDAANGSWQIAVSP